MGILLKNKSSKLNALVSSSLLQLLLMGLLSYLVLNALYQYKTRAQVALVELSDTHSAATSEEVLATLTRYGAAIAHVEIIDKEAAMKLMSEEFSTDINFGTIEGNPFKDIVQFEYDTQSSLVDLKTIKESLESIDGVDGIYAAMSSSSQGIEEGPLAQSQWSKVFFWLIFIAILVMAVIYYASKSSEYIEDNRDMIHSLTIYGSKPPYIRSLFKSYLHDISIKAWMLSLVLFFLCFYLLLTKLGLRITDIGHWKLIIVLILPLLLAYIINYRLLYTKLNKAIENI